MVPCLVRGVHALALQDNAFCSLLALRCVPLDKHTVRQVPTDAPGELNALLLDFLDLPVPPASKL